MIPPTTTTTTTTTASAYKEWGLKNLVGVEASCIGDYLNPDTLVATICASSAQSSPPYAGVGAAVHCPMSTTTTPMGGARMSRPHI